MMKRPRSFISTLVVLLGLLAGTSLLVSMPVDSHAAGLPRVMDPRAGDPTEPDDFPVPGDSGSLAPDQTEMTPRYTSLTGFDYMNAMWSMLGLEAWVLWR